MYNKLPLKENKQLKEQTYKKGDRITFYAPIPWSKGEYKLISDKIQQIYPNFIFTRKRYCVKPMDIRGHENVS